MTVSMLTEIKDDEVIFKNSTFSTRHSLYVLSYTSLILQDVYLGTSGKFIQEKLDKYSAYAIGIDIGLWMKIQDVNGLYFGAVVRNMGTKMKFITNKETQPLEIGAGISYEKKLVSKLLSKIGIGIDVKKIRDGFVGYNLGLKADILDTMYFKGDSLGNL